MRILRSALPLLLLLSGCATVDGEPVASESVAADAAARNPRMGHADKKYQAAIEMIRQGVQAGDESAIEKGRARLAGILSKTDDLNPIEKFFDIYFNNGRVSTAQAHGNKIAADIVMRELMRPGSTKPPSAEEAVRLGLIQPQELIPRLQTQEAYAHLIPQDPFGFTPEGIPLTSTKLHTTPAQPGQKPTGVGLVPGARLTPLQYEVVKSRLANLSKSVWPGEEAQETISNQRDETSDFYQTQRDQQQYSVFQQPQQLIPTPGGRALLGPIMPNAYGPGMNADATGRLFIWQPDFGGPAMGPITPNAYGPGIGMDATGRLVRPACPPGMLC